MRAIHPHRQVQGIGGAFRLKLRPVARRSSDDVSTDVPASPHYDPRWFSFPARPGVFRGRGAPPEIAHELGPLRYINFITAAVVAKLPGVGINMATAKTMHPCIVSR